MYKVHFFDSQFNAITFTAFNETEIDMIYDKIIENGFYYLGLEKLR